MRLFKRRFAYKILVFHVLLLAAVLTLVCVSAREIYNSSRAEELRQVKIRQQIIADEACRGIETYYESIINDLGWIQKRQEADTTRPSLSGLGGNFTRILEGGAQPLAGRVLAEQLGDRVSALFFYNKRIHTVSNLLPENATLTGSDLPQSMRDWLERVETTRVSRFMVLKGQGVSLVAASLGTRDPRLLVAVVPGNRIEAKFFSLLTDRNSASATLFDNRLNVITSANRALDGMNLENFKNADLQALVMEYRDHPSPITRQFPESLSIAGEDLGPRLISISPITISGDTWGLFLAYPLDEIDKSVHQMFSQALIWAAFVALSVTGILVSTAIQMIRYRARLERVRHELLTRELHQARQIQLNWLPDKSSAGPSIDVAAINHPASHISGDFYNWFELADGRQVITIGDVTGHGMAAAFLMATTQLLLRNTMTRLSDPGAAMEEVNRQLSTQMFRGQFVTMLIMVLDFEQGHLEIASAGHPPPLLSEGGAFEEMPVEAHLVLGVEKSVHYTTQRFDLRPRSRLLLYTDGVVDALSATGERFSVKQLMATLARPCASAQDTIDAVLESVSRFRKGRELDDDLTMVAIQVQDLIPPGSVDESKVERRSTLTVSAGR